MSLSDAIAPLMVRKIQRQMIAAGEIDLSIGAEGATAPETLRQMDRRQMALWKVANSA